MSGWVEHFVCYTTEILSNYNAIQMHILIWQKYSLNVIIQMCKTRHLKFKIYGLKVHGKRGF